MIMQLHLNRADLEHLVPIVIYIFTESHNPRWRTRNRHPRLSELSLTKKNALHFYHYVVPYGQGFALIFWKTKG